MLEVRGLQVRYVAVEAVRGIDLPVERGQIVAMLGATGAGKTSTLSAIAGLVPAAGGTVTFDGAPIIGLPPELLARRGIGLVPEGRRIFINLSVVENLILGGAVHAAPPERRARLERMEDRFPILAERRHQKAGLLSGGKQQMLAIARSLMVGPRLLLMDEPSLGLAPQMVERVFDLIMALRVEGLTILVVEQNVPMSLDIADRGIVPANGRVVLSGSAADLAASDKIRSAYMSA